MVITSVDNIQPVEVCDSYSIIPGNNNVCSIFQKNESRTIQEFSRKYVATKIIYIEKSIK